MSYYADTKYAAVKTALDSAFKQLRREGFAARQSYLCCGGCAGADAAGKLREKTAAQRAAFQGVVFYTRQDAADLREYREALEGHARWPRRHGDESLALYLAFGSVEVWDEETKTGTKYGLPTVEVGQALVAALTAAGLDTKWDGSASTRVVVTGLLADRPRFDFANLGVDLDEVAAAAATV